MPAIENEALDARGGGDAGSHRGSYRIEEGMADGLNIRRQVRGGFVGSGRADGQEHGSVDGFQIEAAHADHRVPVRHQRNIPAARGSPLHRHGIGGGDVDGRAGTENLRPQFDQAGAQGLGLRARPV